MRAVGRALPVVEEEQHRRALRHRAEQVAELPERARTNHVAIVLREISTRLALAGEDAEVVLPEVDHHFVELALRRDRARERRRLHLPDELLRFARRLGELRILGEHFATSVLLVHRRVVAAALRFAWRCACCTWL